MLKKRRLRSAFFVIASDATHSRGRRVVLCTEVVMNAASLSFLDIFRQADGAVQLGMASLLFSLLFSLWGLLRLKLRKRKGC